jgi:hypothetical protein
VARGRRERVRTPLLSGPLPEQTGVQAARARSGTATTTAPTPPPAEGAAADSFAPPPASPQPTRQGKRQVDPELVGSIESMIGNLPPKLLEGRPNPEHYRAKFEIVNMISLRHMACGELPGGYKQLIDGIKEETKLAGIDPKVLVDARSESDKALDVVERLASIPSSIWELADEEIAAVRGAMDTADRLCIDAMYENGARESARESAGEAPTPGPKARLRRLLAEVETIRNRVRKPIPDDRRGTCAMDPYISAGIRAAQLLRFMVYVGRSAMGQNARSRPAESVYKVAKHHAEMAYTVWVAENGVGFYPDGSLVERDHQCIMCILICPPGHGKTSIGRAWVGKRICENEYTQGLMNHAKSDEAEKTMGHVAELFRRDTADGRRCLGLYPHLQLADKGNNANSMRLRLDRAVKQPTLMAFGVKGAISGADSDIQWWDDPVDQKEAEQESERNRTFDRLNGTWLTRQRGRNGTMVLVTATLWHHHDAVMRFIRLGLDGKAPIAIKAQRCGGPKTSPAFKSLWPEVYPAADLKTRYAAMNNARLWSAAYMANPIAEENRIVKSVRLYDPEHPSHRRFMQGAVKHLTLDPSATGRVGADRAAALYLAEGELIDETPTADGLDVSSRTVMRYIDGREFYATQTEQADSVAAYCADRPVDWVHIESASWSVAIAEDIHNRYGIDVVQHPVRSKNKEQRLRQCAGLIENSGSEHGFAAVVEFPGIPETDAAGNTRLVPDPRHKWIIEQVVDFGVTANDHGLDALTQVLNYRAADLRPGVGEATTKVRQRIKEDGIDPRKAKMVREFMRMGKRAGAESSEIEEARWASQNW